MSRKTMFRAGAAVAGAAVLLAAAAYLFRAPLSLAVAERIATQRLGEDAVAALPDGLHVGLCGAGSPFTDERRSGPCTLVVAGRRLYVFDAGSGAARNVARMGFNVGRIDAVFLTHFHSDHIDGLGELLLQRWASAANTVPLPVYGPSGVDKVVAGFALAYEADRRFRIAHHGEQTIPPGGFGGVARPFAVTAEPTIVLKDGEVEIAAFAVDHTPAEPSVGYRISYKRRSVVLSGDTKPSAAVRRAAEGVDLLVHEALSPPVLAALERAAKQADRPNLVKIFGDVLDYHTTPEQAAEIARDAKVRFLLLNHIVPTLPLPGLDAAFLGRAPEIFDGPIRIGVDGDFVSLPAGSVAVKLGRRF